MKQAHDKRPDDLVTATEIASFVYCPEQWRLQYGLGKPSANRAALDAGTRHHARKAASERFSGVSLVTGRFLVLLALLSLAWLVLGR